MTPESDILERTHSLLTFNSENLSCDVKAAVEAGQSLSAQYRSARPFPHIVIDNFIDADILHRILREWPPTEDRPYFNRAQERLKYQWDRAEIGSTYIRSFLAEMNSPGVIRFIEEMTGIKKLVPDPYFFGGGLHETKAGGHLSVHADFNVHSELALIRRINLLVYLNDDWDDEFGGHLELWDTGMTRCVHKISPKFARAVIFNTDSDAFHGQPEPLRCPPDRSRRSLALYYYTAAEEGIKTVRKRTTQFKPRPQSADRTDWTVRRKEFLEDWVPPVLLRTARRGAGAVRRRLGDRS